MKDIQHGFLYQPHEKTEKLKLLKKSLVKKSIKKCENGSTTSKFIKILTLEPCDVYKKRGAIPTYAIVNLSFLNLGIKSTIITDNNDTINTNSGR